MRACEPAKAGRVRNAQAATVKKIRLDLERESEAMGKPPNLVAAY
jgi:hypothetical protein